MAGTAQATVLVRNAPGTDGGALLYQAARERLVDGGQVLWVALDRAPARVRVGLERFGYKGDGPLVLDGHAPRLGMVSDAAYHADPSDIAALTAELQKAGADHPDALWIIDSLNGIPEGTPEEQDALMAAIIGHGHVLARFTPWGDEDTPLAPAFDHAMRLRGVEQRVITREYVQWSRLDGTERDASPALPVRLQPPHGIRVYIPKLLVTGPFNAGKSRFVHAVSDAAVSAERRGTTVVMDRGHATVHGLDAEVFGTPGQERFDPLLDTLSAQAVGVVLMVDATDPDTFPRAEQMLNKVWRRDLPAVVVANKQDLPDALSPEEVQARLSLPAPMPVIGCETTDRDAARAVLEVLVARILEGPR